MKVSPIFKWQLKSSLEKMFFNRAHIPKEDFNSSIETPNPPTMKIISIGAFKLLYKLIERESLIRDSCDNGLLKLRLNFQRKNLSKEEKHSLNELISNNLVFKIREKFSLEENSKEWFVSNERYVPFDPSKETIEEYSSRPLWEIQRTRKRGELPWEDYYVCDKYKEIKYFHRVVYIPRVISKDDLLRRLLSLEIVVF